MRGKPEDDFFEQMSAENRIMKSKISVARSPNYKVMNNELMAGASVNNFYVSSDQNIGSSTSYTLTTANQLIK